MYVCVCACVSQLILLVAFFFFPRSSREWQRRWRKGVWRCTAGRHGGCGEINAVDVARPSHASIEIMLRMERMAIARESYKAARPALALNGRNEPLFLRQQVPRDSDLFPPQRHFVLCVPLMWSHCVCVGTPYDVSLEARHLRGKMVVLLSFYGDSRVHAAVRRHRRLVPVPLVADALVALQHRA